LRAAAGVPAVSLSVALFWGASVEKHFWEPMDVTNPVDEGIRVKVV